jgi:hypothetical protein
MLGLREFPTKIHYFNVSLEYVSGNELGETRLGKCRKSVAHPLVCCCVKAPTVRRAVATTLPMIG